MTEGERDSVSTPGGPAGREPIESTSLILRATDVVWWAIVPVYSLIGLATSAAIRDTSTEQCGQLPGSVGSSFLGLLRLHFPSTYRTCGVVHDP